MKKKNREEKTKTEYVILIEGGIMNKRKKIRKNSPLWYIHKYWIVFMLWIGVVILAYLVTSTVIYPIIPKTHRVIVTPVPTSLPHELKIYTIAVLVEETTEVAEVTETIVEVSKPLGGNHFSRGSYTERQMPTSKTYNENDVILLASILEVECPSESRLPDWDRRLEANVILNRHVHYGGTLQSIIEAGNGTQFNGIRTKSYKNKEYSQESYDAAYAILILGERVLDEDIRFFSNLSTATDKRFINSIDWVLKQNSKYGHSFGRTK